MTNTIKIIVDGQTIILDRYSNPFDLYVAIRLDLYKKNIVRKTDGMPLEMLPGVPKYELKTVNHNYNTVEVRVTKSDHHDVLTRVRTVDYLSREITNELTYAKEVYRQLHFNKKIASTSIYGGDIGMWLVYIPISRLYDNDDDILIEEIKKAGCEFWISSKDILELARNEIQAA